VSITHINTDNYETTSETIANQINDIVNAGGTAEVKVKKLEKKRSIPANGQQWVWYGQIAKFTSTDAKTVAAECKIDFGLPILLNDPDVGDVLRFALRGFDRMTRDQQIKFIYVIQVTSLMNSKQHMQYRDDILYYYNTQGLAIDYLK